MLKPQITQCLGHQIASILKIQQAASFEPNQLQPFPSTNPTTFLLPFKTLIL